MTGPVVVGDAQAGATGRRPMVIAASIAVAALFAPTLLSFHSVWLSERYAHGYPIAAVVLWFVWSQRHTLVPSDRWPPALPVGAGLSVLWLLARIGDVQVATQAAVPALALTWCAHAIGQKAAWRLAPGAAVFMVAVPLWDVMIRPLQLVTVTVASTALALMGVPARIDGVMIHLTHGSFIIEDACAGFNYFMAGLSIGAMYGLVLLRGWRSRLVVVAVAVALAIVANWVRVTSLIVIGHVTEMQADVIYHHGTYGWVIFVLSLLAFFPIANRVDRREAALLPREEVPASTVSSPGSVHQRRLLAASATIVLGPVLYLVIGAVPPREPSQLTVAEAPSVWQAEAVAAPEPNAWRPAYRGAQEHSTARWSDGSSDVLVDRLAFRDQSQGSELIGYGNQIAPDSLIAARRSIGPVGVRRRIVRAAVVAENGGFRLVWYWYRVGGIETASPLKAKLLEIPAFLSRRTVSELVAVSTPCDSGNCEDASLALASFLGS